VFLRPLCDKNKVHVISSGIWVTPYLEAPAPIDMNQPNIVFTGKMDYRPNVDAMLWFVEAILPLIHAQMPSVHLYIVGQQPHARLEGLKSNPNITITGKVESVLPYLYGAGVYIAPLRMGSGTRLKLLEAMACGCAIVATTIAASGLGDEVKSAMILADSADIVAENIIGLLHHPQKRGELSAFAREYVRGRYDWSAILPHLVDVYRGLGLQVS